MIKLTKNFRNDIEKAMRIRKRHILICAEKREVDWKKFEDEEKFCQKVANKMLRLKCKEGN